jgi:ribosomal protein S19
LNLKKLKFIDTNVLKYVWKRSRGLLKRIKSSKTYSIRVWSRRSSIPKSLIGRRLRIHKGNIFSSKRVTKLTTFRKTGEFSFTRKLLNYSVNKK